MRSSRILFSLRSKLFFAFFSVTALITMTISYSMYNHMRSDHTKALSQQLKNIAAVASLQVEGDVIEQIVSQEQETSREYNAVKENLSNIANKIPEIKYIYTMRKTQEEGQYTFIVDVDPDAESVAHVGESYDGSTLPAMASGFVTPSADQDFTTDQWGTILSGYAPIRNSNNEIVAIVGIDIDAQVMVDRLADFTRMVIYQTLIIIVLCALIIFVIANRFTRRFRLINKAIDEIASGNCDISLDVGGEDAIAHLSARINHLAAIVHSERENMLLSTIEALVNALEAKDKYTSGHSSEVESLARAISIELKLPEEEIFKISIAAVLHDVGKIGVSDELLHKEDKFTEEEWLLVRQHPSIGAAIISGIPSLHDIVQMVLHHHARWDGTGYPETLSRLDIPLGARIIAVADSFQAMVSNRPYRRGMPVEEAIGELKACAGTQFDPTIVEVFLKVWEKRKNKS